MWGTRLADPRAFLVARPTAPDIFEGEEVRRYGSRDHKDGEYSKLQDCIICPSSYGYWDTWRFSHGATTKGQITIGIPLRCYPMHLEDEALS